MIILDLRRESVEELWFHAIQCNAQYKEDSIYRASDVLTPYPLTGARPQFDLLVKSTVRLICFACGRVGWLEPCRVLYRLAN